MDDTISSTDSNECCEAGEQKTGFQEFGPILKKPKTQILPPQNEDNSEVAESQDRFGDMPDSLILHILSFMETKDAIRTCVLSKRWSIPSLDDLTIDIREPHDQMEKSHQKQREKVSHGLINMVRGDHDAELSFCTVEVTCGGTAAMLKQECSAFSELKSLNLGVGSTYKIFISNLDHITAYFRHCSQHADFELLTV
ncbi:Leucine-rich repeat domain superfamily [Sesbania bispinosa]|nr:Leucine-rich repeat domain superfamily [Sesbania bispinosa]